MKTGLLAFFLFSFLLLKAQSSFILTDSGNAVHTPALHHALRFQEIPETHTSFNELSSNFTSIDTFDSSPIHPSSLYWFRLPLINTSQDHKLWFFEILDPHVQNVHVAVVSPNDTIYFSSSGFNKHFFSRPSQHKNFVFPLRFHGTDSLTVYFSLQSNYKTDPAIGVRSAESFMNYALSEYFYLGLFYGILFIMGVYNFFIFITTRERIYLYYVLYVLGYCLNAFKEDGLGFQYLWPSYPWINLLVDFLAPFLLIVFFTFYSKKFLFIKRHEFINILTNLVLGIFCLLYMMNYFFFRNPWLQYNYLLPLLVVFYAGIKKWKSGNRSAKYLLLGLSFFFFSLVVFFLRITNLIDTNLYTVYSLNFGFLVEVVVFSYALGQRLRIEKEEKARQDKALIGQLEENQKLKDSLNIQLEQKVEERTREVAAKNQQLSQALTELEEKNSKIEQLNQLLEKDNKNLNENIRDITKARWMLKNLTFEEFKKIYPNEHACLQYLNEIKWEKNFTCKKCGSKKYSSGKSPFSKRCTKCGYDESVTSYTLFHKSKLPVTTTFYLAYLVLDNPEISSHELSSLLNLRQKTCWAFKKKILQALNEKPSTRLSSKDWGKIFYHPSFRMERE